MSPALASTFPCACRPVHLFRHCSATRPLVFLPLLSDNKHHNLLYRPSHQTLAVRLLHLNSHASTLTHHPRPCPRSPKAASPLPRRTRTRSRAPRPRPAPSTSSSSSPLLTKHRPANNSTATASAACPRTRSRSRRTSSRATPSLPSRTPPRLRSQRAPATRQCRSRCRPVTRGRKVCMRAMRAMRSAQRPMLTGTMISGRRKARTTACTQLWVNMYRLVASALSAGADFIPCWKVKGLHDVGTARVRSDVIWPNTITGPQSTARATMSDSRLLVASCEDTHLVKGRGTVAAVLGS